MLHHELGQRLLGLFRALVRRGAQAQTERGFRRDNVEGSFHRMRVEPDDGDAGLRPQTRGERTGAGKTIRFDDARVGAHSRLVHITLQAANRFLGRNARHDQIAIGVVHGGNQHRSQRVRVKNRAAILAGMHRMFQRLDMHINIGVATQRRGQRRNLSGPVAEWATMITSEANSSRCSSMNGMKLGEPISSSPSMNTLMFTFRSSPSAFSAPE